MRRGIHFETQASHEVVHLAPLAERLRDVRAGQPEVAEVVVSAASRTPHKGVRNVQVFHGLGDKGYTLNPLYLQAGRYPRLRTAANMALRALRLPAPFLRPPEPPGRRPGRYEQVNAYGPRFHDAMRDMLKDTEVSKFGHVVLNERESFQLDPEGPLLWLPTWDNRRFFGGANQSSLAGFTRELGLVSRHVRVRVKYHPLTVAHNQDAKARAEIAKEPGIEVVEPTVPTYDLLDGCRGVLTDTSSIGFEAYCMGVPVAIAKPRGVEHHGLHGELAQRVFVAHSGRPDLLGWAEEARRDQDVKWARDLLYAPSRQRNDDFAAALRQHTRA